MIFNTSDKCLLDIRLLAGNRKSLSCGI